MFICVRIKGRTRNRLKINDIIQPFKGHDVYVLASLGPLHDAGKSLNVNISLLVFSVTVNSLDVILLKALEDV